MLTLYLRETMIKFQVRVPLTLSNWHTSKGKVTSTNDLIGLIL